MIKKILDFCFFENKEEFKKIFILSLCFFIVTGSYILLRELRDSVFLLIVGKKYIPSVKIISYFLMLPFGFFYAWISEKIRKSNLISFYSIYYGIGGLILSYFIRDPVIGIANNISSPDRIFGWIFYLFCEGYAPFMVGVTWAFFNSISFPNDLKKKYVFITIACKLGGVFFSFLAWMFTSRRLTFGLKFSDVYSYYYIILFCSFLLLIIPFLVFYLNKRFEEDEFIGYSKEKTKKNNDLENKNTGSGLFILLKTPYVLGIFGMIFFWETVNVIFNYMRIGIAFSDSSGIADFLANLYKTIMFSYLAGFLLATFGTSFAFKFIKERVSLILIPLCTGIAVLICIFIKTSNAVFITYIIIRAINSAFALPLRESLYIPTSQDIQFKVKSWIDSFGTKFSKMIGSFYNILAQYIPLGFLHFFQIGFFSLIIVIWIILAYFLGLRWERAVKNKEVIGNK
jgi:AAA family ATP:ADP antiporter